MPAGPCHTGRSARTFFVTDAEAAALLVFQNWTSMLELLRPGSTALQGVMESWLPGTASPASLMRVRRAWRSTVWPLLFHAGPGLRASPKRTLACPPQCHGVVLLVPTRASGEQSQQSGSQTSDERLMQQKRRPPESHCTCVFVLGGAADDGGASCPMSSFDSAVALQVAQ